MINGNFFLKMNIREIFKKYPFIINIFNNYGLKCEMYTFSEKVTLEEVLKTSKLPSKKIIEEISTHLKGELKV